MDRKNSTTNVDDYISAFPEGTRQLLELLRKTIRDAAPGATEKISYQMPTFFLNGNLVHFAAQKTHIGFYPAPSGIEFAKDKLTGYEYSKGAIRFPFNQPLPLELISSIVRFRVQENTSKPNKM